MRFIYPAANKLNLVYHKEEKNQEIFETLPQKVDFYPPMGLAGEFHRRYTHR